MKKLILRQVGAIDKVVWPRVADHLDFDLPATEVFVDFLSRGPAVVDIDTPAHDAELAMKREHARLKLVVDDGGYVCGTVTREQLSDEEIVKKVAEGSSRHELRVRDFMTPRQSLRVLEYADLTRATLGDVIQALESEGHSHCVVTDGERQGIRGFISLDDIRGHVDRARTSRRDSPFADIFKAVYHG